MRPIDAIRIDVGVCTSLEVDLTGFDFTGVQKVVLTIKNRPKKSEPVLLEREYVEAKVYDEIITATESFKIKPGAVYDFDKVLIDGRRFKISGNGSVELRQAVGQCETG